MVVKAHRDEKISRMQSAAIIAQKAKSELKDEPGDKIKHQAAVTSGASITEDGKILLHGNPLHTTPEVLCLVCRLPRLRYPTTGRNSRIPEPGKEYCAKQPYISKDGCDIYGKPLNQPKPTNKSKAAKVAKTKTEPSPDESESPGGSQPNGREPDKPVSTPVPSTKCPNCMRYSMPFSRIAQHLDRCMGIGGRKAAKDATEKMSQGTPRESRANTPKQAVPNNKRKLEKGSPEETEDGTTPKKKKSDPKKKDTNTKEKKAVNSTLQRVKGAVKPLPGQSSNDNRGVSPASKERGKETDVPKDDSSKKPPKVPPITEGETFG